MRTPSLNSRFLRLSAVAAALIGGLGAAQAAVTVAQTDDVVLAERVAGVLQAAPALNAAATDLRLSVQGGEVRLAGWVAQPQDVALAQRIAAATPGVERAVGQPRVWSSETGVRAAAAPDDAELAPRIRVAQIAAGTPDGATAHRVAHALRHNLAVASGATDVQVSADHGVVQLSGWLPNADVEAAAIEAAAQVPGVQAVDADVHLWSTGSQAIARPLTPVAPPAPAIVASSPADLALGAEVRAALARTAPFQESASSLTVVVSQGQVQLGGWVAYADDVQLAGRTAAAVPGVQAVSTRLHSWSSDAR